MTVDKIACSDIKGRQNNNPIPQTTRLHKANPNLLGTLSITKTKLIN